MIEIGTKEFKRIFEQARIELECREQPLPYASIIQAVERYENFVKEDFQIELSPIAKDALVRELECYVDVIRPVFDSIATSQ
ncbi:hypothetical protein FACS1894139_13930 [Planctomycetales bacterium]|nr:hypothetical protein FACS1894139_13930 [Planctomycetales bacterium]GHV20938.1 hypothetical protein AGMMS49959_09240 [Planctomycetales bacterium]